MVPPLLLLEVGRDSLRRRILDLPMACEVIYIIKGKLKSYPMVERQTSGASAAFSRLLVNPVSYPAWTEAKGSASQVTGAHV